MHERHEAEMIREQKRKAQARHAFNAVQYLTMAQQCAERLPLSDTTVDARQLIAQAHLLLWREIRALGGDAPTMPEPFDVAADVISRNHLSSESSASNPKLLGD